MPRMAPPVDQGPLFGGLQLENQQTKSHQRENTRKIERPRTAAEKDFDKRADREAFRAPPADAVETAFRHGWWFQDREKVIAAMKAANVGAARLERFLNCGCDAVVEYNAEERRHRIRANYCGDRWCYSCQKARAKKLAAALLAFVLMKQTKFITLTIRADQRSLVERRRHLLDSFGRLRRTKFFRSAITGGAYCTQVTRGDSGGHWHVHLHVLAHASYVCSRRLSRAWKECSGDSKIVHVRAVRNAEKDAGYVARYATKGCERDVVLDPDSLCEAVVALRGARMLATFGSFWGCRVVRMVPNNAGWARVGRLVHVYHAARRGEEWAAGCLRSLRVVVTGTGERPEFEYVERFKVKRKKKKRRRAAGGGGGGGPPGQSDIIE